MVILINVGWMLYVSLQLQNEQHSEHYDAPSIIDIVDNTHTNKTSELYHNHRSILLPPLQYYKTFCMSNKSAKLGVLPFFIELGYKRVRYWEDAHIIWSPSVPSRTANANKDDPSIFTKLERWQRLGRIPTHKMLNDKGLYIKWMKLISQHTGQSIEYIPRTYILHDDDEIKEVLLMLQQELFVTTNNTNRISPNPWILKHGTSSSGKGVTMMGPGSIELREFYKQLSVYYDKNSNKINSTSLVDSISSSKVSKFEKDMKNSRYTLQAYICNLLLYQGRKFDLRVYWLVVSIDPLNVLFHYGQIRANPTIYNTTHFESDSLKHMTHAGHGSEVLNWKVLEDLVTQHYETNKEELSLHVGTSTSPFDHVVNQMKHILGHIVESYKDIAFQSIITKQQLSSDDGYQLFGADFSIDEDLDVFFIEVQTGPLLVANYTKSHYFATLCKNVIQSTLNLIEEVQHTQSQGLPVLSLANLGTFDPIPIYSNGKPYKYNNYKGHKQNKRPCQFRS